MRVNEQFLRGGAGLERGEKSVTIKRFVYIEIDKPSKEGL